MLPMSVPALNRSCLRFLFRATAAALLAAFLGLAPAAAQVVALVNGAPVTELDIQQRIKIIQLTTHKSASRQEALKALVDDHLKISVMKRYNVEPSVQDVDNAFANMAQRSRTTTQAMEQALTRQGVSVAAFKFKVKADYGWTGVIRGKFASSFQINDVDVRNALETRTEADKDAAAAASNTYTLYPVTFVAPAGAPEGARRTEAENLRSRFTSCDEGLKLARVLRGVVVREAIKRNSADLAPQLREVLDKMEVGRLTAPEVTPQGIQMFALCERQNNDADSPAKRAARERILEKRFETESKKYLEEVRRQSMIEYR
jgi:peptidyl-prolyl cis-trans isomerase SurA